VQIDDLLEVLHPCEILEEVGPGRVAMTNRVAPEIGTGRTYRFVYKHAVPT
jgi:hypothetical protein